MPAENPRTTPTDERPVQDLTYEQAREELVTVVARLEAGSETLEGSLTLWERGELLAARCQEWLDGARRRLDGARADAPGQGSAVDAAGRDSAVDAAGRGRAVDPAEPPGDDRGDRDDRDDTEDQR